MTPDGYLYSREAILESLLRQKKALKRKLADWEAEQAAEAERAAQKAAVESEAALIAFDRANHLGIRDETARGLEAAIKAEAGALVDGRGGAAKSVINNADAAARAKGLNAFWVPSKAPEGARGAGERPDASATVCPASGKRLRLKDLVAVKFTQVPGGEPPLCARSAVVCVSVQRLALLCPPRRSPTPSRLLPFLTCPPTSPSLLCAPARPPRKPNRTEERGRYMDPITKDALTNASKLVVLAPTGDVMLEATYEACVRPEGAYRGKKVGKGGVADEGHEE